MTTPVLMAFSPMRWDFLFQRPQQLLSRLAGRWQVLYVEEPLHCTGTAWLEVLERGPQLTVLVPHMPLAEAGVADAQHPALQALLAAHLDARRLAVDVAWLYTPLALPLAQALRPACTVYDCMDELSTRPGASAALLAHEAALLEAATMVLAAGPSLYEAKRRQHAKVYCLPSAVDADHFAAARLQAGSAHALEAGRLQGGLPRPRLGYFGVIDARLDFVLLDRLAQAHPEWALVMVGPVVGIDPATLPQRPNLHWLGPQPYARLPYLVADWDLCLLPFAENPSNRYINPTKTLEYMAADKPVVGTALHDVLWLYGDAVAIVRAPADFGQVCAAVLAESPAERCRRATEMLSIVCMYSWERSADSVHKLLARALAAVPAPAAARAVAAATAAPL